MSSGPHQINMGCWDVSKRRTAVFKLCGQPIGAPRGVFVQSWTRVSAPISPPPKRKSSLISSGTGYSLRTPEFNRGTGTIGRHVLTNTYADAILPHRAGDAAGPVVRGLDGSFRQVPEEGGPSPPHGGGVDGVIPQRGQILIQ